MSDVLLIYERNQEIVALTEELRELQDLQRMLGSLVEEQRPEMTEVEDKVIETEIKVTEGTQKIEHVSKKWWRCTLL